MATWEQRRLDDSVRLLKWLIGQGATKGAVITRVDMATAMGWPVTRVDVLTRWLREHPELGFAISMQRGSEPWVVVSTPTKHISGKAVLAKTRISYEAVLESYWRIARAVATEFAHQRNIARNGPTPEKRAAQKRCKEHRSQLVLIQSALKPDRRPVEADLDDFIDSVLAL